MNNREGRRSGHRWVTAGRLRHATFDGNPRVGERFTTLCGTYEVADGGSPHHCRDCHECGWVLRAVESCPDRVGEAAR